jgi:hypothetical protein
VADLPKGSDEKSKFPDLLVNKNNIFIEKKYNFYAEYAEDTFKGEDVDNKNRELVLPNLYTYYSLLKKKSDYYKELASLGKTTPIDPENFSLKEYYNITSDVTLSDLPYKTPVALDNFPYGAELETGYRYKSIIIDDKGYLNEANSIADIFPMHTKITLPTVVPEDMPINNKFLDLLSKNNCVKEFITLLGNYFSTIRTPESF